MMLIRLLTLVLQTGAKIWAPVFVALFALLPGSLRADYLGGASVLSITPTAGESEDACMGGYGYPYYRCGSVAVADEISVRALALADADSVVVWLALDTVGVGDELDNRIRQRVVVLSGGAIAPGQLMISATHTHSGPDLQGLWGGVSEAYTERVVQQAAMAVMLALLQMQPVQVSAGQATVPVKNRRLWREVDDGVSVLAMHSRYTGLPIGLLINMSAHPVILDRHNQAYSADFVHPLRQQVEAHWGGAALFVNGVVGDAIPALLDVKDKTVNRGDVSAQRYGKEAAAGVLSALAGAKAVSGPLQLNSVKQTLTVENALILLATYCGLLDVSLVGWNQLEMRFSLIRLGQDVAMLSVPGEALSRLGLPLKSKLRGDSSTRISFWLGLTNGSYGYFIPPDEYGRVEGRSTEERAAISPGAGERVREIIESMLH